ncbi:DUF6446 family protein [Rubrimonas cliftonensis]|nr:DUF6446 family protein [Rubrimonas cliftonensis]
MIALLAFAALFGAALWYAQVYAWYERDDGRTSVLVGENDTPVSDYRGLAGDSSPLKLRGCFTIDPAALEGAPEAADPAPLVAPKWFDCYDAAALGADLEAGRARAVEAGREPQGFRRIVAVYPDGRAFQWREVVE